MGSDPSALDPYVPPEIDVRDVAIANAVYARRPAVECEIAGFSARISPAWADQDEPGPERSTISLRIDNAPVKLLVDTVLIERVLASVDGLLDAANLPPGHAGLLLEFVLRDVLSRLERRAGVKLSIISVGDGDIGLSDGIWIRFSLVIDELGASCCWLMVPHQLAVRLGSLLARGGLRPSPVSTQLPVALRIGHVTLAAAELRSLRVGDILLAEETCAPATAAAVIAEHLAAPVELTAEGPRLVGAPGLLTRSPLSWSGGPPLPEGSAEGGSGGLPVRVFFELGRHSIASSDVRRLASGSRLPVRPQNGGLVNIVAQDRRIGCGEPMTVGQGGGLRILRLFNDE